MKGPLPEIALVRREILRQLRSRGLFLILVLSSGLGSVVFIIQLYGLSTLGAWSAEILFGVCAITLFFIALTVIPLVGGASICSERQRDTYDLMCMTMLRPYGIVLAKTASTFCAFAAVATGILPLFGVTFFYVGVMPVQMLQAATYIFLTSLSIAAFSTACSAYFQRTAAAILASFLMAAGVCGLFVLLPSLLFILLGEPFRGIAANILNQSPAIWSPVAGLFTTLNRGVNVDTLVAHGMYQTALILVASLIARWRIHKTSATENGSGRLADAPPEDLLPASASHASLSTLQAKRVQVTRPWKQIPDRGNPLQAKEAISLAGRSFWKRRIGFITFAVVLVLSVVIAWESTSFGPGNGISGRGLHMAAGMYFFLVTLLMLVLIPAIVGPSFAREREQENLDLLRSTLLSPAQLVTGKMLGAWQFLGTILVGILLGSLPLLLLIEEASFLDATYVALVMPGRMGITLAMATGLTLLVSVRSDAEVTAMVRSFLLCLLMLVLLPLLIVSIVSLIALLRYSNDVWLEPYVVLVSPFASQYLEVFAPQNEYSTISMAASVAHAILAYVLVRLAILFTARGMRDK